jgi:hypothetical protein
LTAFPSAAELGFVAICPPSFLRRTRWRDTTVEGQGWPVAKVIDRDFRPVHGKGAGFYKLRESLSDASRIDGRGGLHDLDFANGIAGKVEDQKTVNQPF